MAKLTHTNVAAVYEDFRPGTYDRDERLADMDLNHVEAAMCYPNIFPRFAGQGFAERDDKELGLRCLQIYNDWMIDHWCGGPARGRMIPLTLVPLWAPALAAAHVESAAGRQVFDFVGEQRIRPGGPYQGPLRISFVPFLPV